MYVNKRVRYCHHMRQLINSYERSAYDSTQKNIGILRDFSIFEKSLFLLFIRSTSNSIMASIPKRIERIERLVPD